MDAALPQLEQLAEQALRTSGVPGMSIAVVYRDEVVFAGGVGVRRAGEPARVDADTVFQLASLSKPVASTVLAALAGDGVIGWDDRIIDYDPGFRMWDSWVTGQVTLRDMFCHRSGLPDHAGDLLEDLGYDRAEVLRRLRFQRPDSSFRSAYAYTNFGFTEAAVAAARAAGKGWEELSTERLYRPLGMRSTSSRFADFTAARNRAAGHARVDGRWVAKHVRDPQAQAPAGGVSSTARDMARWLRLQLAGGKFDGRQLIPTAALEETHRPQLVNGFNPVTGRSVFYGLGWNVSYDDQGRVRLGHSGAFELGAATSVMLVPAEQLGIVALTNSSPVGVPEAVSATFLDLVLYGKPEQDWSSIYAKAMAAINKPDYGGEVDYSKPPARPSPALPSTAYRGAYGNDFVGEIRVVEREGGLALQAGPKPMLFPLRHWDRDVFLYQPPGENAGGLSAVTFTVGNQGTATGIVVENLNIHGEGGFTRVPAAK